ncbi:hypothetical protein BT69DRAFT_1281462, partial [Atractiella rhizophila]
MSESTFRLLSLPHELISKILSIHSSSRSALQSLSLVSRALRDLVTPALFRTLTFSAKCGLQKGLEPAVGFRYLRSIDSHPAISSVRLLRIRLVQYELFDLVPHEIEYLAECLRALEGLNVEALELTVLGDPEELKSNIWAGDFVNGLEASLKHYPDLRELKMDLSFQYGVDSTSSVARLLSSLKQARVERISLNVYGPLDIIFHPSEDGVPKESVLSAPCLKHLALTIKSHFSSLALRPHALPCHLQTLSFTNPGAWPLDFDFDSIYYLLSVSSASLEEIEFEDYEHELDIASG